MDQQGLKHVEKTSLCEKRHQRKKILIITYLIYIILYETLCLGGGAFIVIKYNKSFDWMMLGLLCGAVCFKPRAWYALWDGVER